MSDGNRYSGIFVAFGLIVSSLVLAQAIRDFKRGDRYVTVKGLVERDVQSNLALWQLQLRTTDNDLAKAQSQAGQHLGAVREFLSKSGIKEEEVQYVAPRVIDRSAQDYSSTVTLSRYVIESNILIRSARIDVVSNLSAKLTDLVSAGVPVTQTNSCEFGPKFIFTELNSIKPEMIAEATRNARASAERFAADSGSRVGAIRQANQGTFVIAEQDAGADGGDGSCGRTSSILKKVRVVATVDYFLDS